MQSLVEIEPLKSLAVGVPCFWRDELLSEHDQRLLNALDAAHHASVFRDNMSTTSLLNAGVGSGNYANGIAAACLSIGGPHAPLAQSMALLSAHDPRQLASQIMADGGKVPGWGNSFIKGKPDPAWTDVDEQLKLVAPKLHETIAAITDLMHESSKTVWPNPSIYTAAVAIHIGVPPSIAPYLFIAGRLNAWTELLGRHLA